MAEVPLVGGGRSEVWRDGDIVLRRAGPWTASVHALLRHLEAEGFEGAPRVVGSGFDASGRETLSFIQGESAHPKAWGDVAFPHIGRLLRDLHRATRSFALPPDAVWRDWHGRALGHPGGAVGHCDAGPWNILARGGTPMALIDWEAAGPVDPLYELAQACWLNAQLHDDDVAERQGLPSLEERARHARLILDGYGLPGAQRAGFVDKMIEFALQDAAAEASAAGPSPNTTESSPLWGITWRVRGAAWMLRHRAALELIIEKTPV